MAYPYREGCARRCAKLRAVGLDGVQGVPQQVTEPPHPPNSTNPSHETPRCTLTLCYRGTACGPDGAARNLLALLRSCSAGDLPLPPPRAAKWLASTWALASRPQNHFFYVEVDCTTSGPVWSDGHVTLAIVLEARHLIDNRRKSYSDQHGKCSHQKFQLHLDECYSNSSLEYLFVVDRRDGLRCKCL